MAKKKSKPTQKSGSSAKSKAAQYEREMEAARASLSAERKRLWLIAGGFALYLIVVIVLMSVGVLSSTSKQLLIGNLVIIVICSVLLFRQLGRVNDRKTEVQEIEKKLGPRKR